MSRHSTGRDRSPVIPLHCSHAACVLSTCPHISRVACSEDYFQRFRDSFRSAKSLSQYSVLGDLVASEHSCRRQLQTQEEEEFYCIIRGFAPIVAAAVPPYHVWRRLTLADAEKVCRTLLVHDYYQMLLEGCEVQEQAERYDWMFREERRSRECISSREVPEWIESRRRETQRKQREENLALQAEVTELDAAIMLRRLLARQQAALFIAEEHARWEIEREQRLGAGTLHDTYMQLRSRMFSDSLRHTRIRGSLGERSSRAVVVEEVSARCAVVHEEQSAFLLFAAREARAYLTARKRSFAEE